jgi:hypothetical protein
MANEEAVMGKVADAVKETAKTTGKAIDAVSGVGSFFDRVFGGLVTDAVGLLADRLRFYRLERLHLLAEKTKQRLSARGIDITRPLQPKVALPLLESATLEEDDHLHTLWANLLASGLDPDAEPLERKFVSALAEMTADDAYTFESLWAEWHKPPPRPVVVQHSEPGRGIRGSDDYGEIPILTLNRLGLIAPSFTVIKNYIPGGDNRYGSYGPEQEAVKIYGNLDRVIITEFGLAFGCAIGLKADGQ